MLLLFQSASLAILFSSVCYSCSNPLHYFPPYELMTPSILSHPPRQLSLGLTVSRHSDVYLPYSSLRVFLIYVYLPWSYGLSHNSFFVGLGNPFPGLFVSKFSPSCGPLASKISRFDAPIEAGLEIMRNRGIEPATNRVRGSAPNLLR